MELKWAMCTFSGCPFKQRSIEKQEHENNALRNRWFQVMGEDSVVTEKLIKAQRCHWEEERAMVLWSRTETTQKIPTA